MKSSIQPNPATYSTQRSRSARRTLLALLAPIVLMPLAGCLSVRVRAVNRTVIADHVLDSTLDQLVQRLDSQYAAVQTMNAKIEITASTGGEHEGEVKDYPTLTGLVILRKASDLRVLMQAPVIRSTALDMVSDGKTFKLLIAPPRSKAVEGVDTCFGPSKTGLQSLRPCIIRDALLIPAKLPDEFVTITQSSRILPPIKGKKELVEEPDYDLTVLRTRSDHVLEPIRVIHISRVTLQPYRQDVFDAQGRIVTIVTYNHYQKFGEVDFPMSILIERPLDEYKLNLAVSKLTLNQKVDDDAFVFKFPEGLPVEKM